MEKVAIVTGARGFIGRYVSRALARSGYIVVGIGHGRWDEHDWREWGLSAWHESEVTTASLRSCGSAPHSIIHLAGGSSVPASLANPLTDFERTVVSTARVLDFVRTYSPSTRVVYPSSASIYGATDAVPITESEPPAPISPYGVHKWLSEQMLSMYASQYHIPSAIVRLFSVYGCGLRKQLLWDACRKVAAGDYEFMGTGDEVRDWLHVEDAAELILLAVQNAATGCPIVNAGSGKGVSVREILTAIVHGFRADPIRLRFSGSKRAGDPTQFIADISCAKEWGWNPRRLLIDEIDEYRGWWQSEMLVSLPRQENALVEGASKLASCAAS
jgi:UDP-glucose 4-epimerase